MPRGHGQEAHATEITAKMAVLLRVTVKMAVPRVLPPPFSFSTGESKAHDQLPGKGRRSLELNRDVGCGRERIYSIFLAVRFMPHWCKINLPTRPSSSLTNVIWASTSL